MAKFIRRTIVCFMIAALVAGNLSNQMRVQAENSNNMGAKMSTQLDSGEKVYEEETVSLPDFDINNSEAVLGMTCNPKGYCEIYTGKNDNGKQVYLRYTQNAKGDWTTSEIKWSDVFGDDDEKYPSIFQYSKDGELYCIAKNNETGNKLQQWLVKISNDGTVQKINSATLSKKNEAGEFLYVCSYIITDNDLFIFSDGLGNLLTDNMLTGKMVYENSDYGVLNMAAGSDVFYFVDYNTGKIEKMDINTGNEIDSYSLPFQEECDEDDYMATNLMTYDNSLYVISSNGIYQYSNDNFKCLVEGYANRLSQPSKNHNSFYAMSSDGSFYNIGNNQAGLVSLTKYSAKTETMKQYQGEFTVAMYHKNARVMEAIAQLSEKYPDINVKCVYLSRNSDIETQKAQCEKADAIICDNTLYTSLKSDNILKDISATAQSLIRTEGLYANIINDFYEGRNLYAMPADFSAYIYLGNKKLLASTNSLNSLMKYVKKNKTKVWQGMDYETLGAILYRAYNKELINENGEWNEKEIIKLLKSLKKTCSVDPNYLFTTEKQWFRGGCFDTYEEHLNSLFFTPIDNILEWLYLQCYVIGECDNSYKCTGSFETDSLVGINKNSDNTLSNEFMKLIYGADAQSIEIYSNLPLKCSSLDEYEDIQKMLYGAKTHIQYNEHQSKAMQQALELYMTGNRSLDDTVKRIISNKTYVKSYSSLSLDATSKELNVLFIGNSLTRVSKITEQFGKMAELNGKKIKVNTCLYDGCTLNRHISALNKESKKLLKNADVVIFQEYGGKRDTTASDVKKLMDRGKKNAKFLFYLTDCDTNKYNCIERRVGQNDNLSFIPAGHVHDLLISKKMYTYEELHQPNDYHQNPLYAFVIAQTIYATLFDQDLSKIKYNDFASYIDTYLKGATNQDKQAEVEQIQGVTKEVFEKD